MVGVVRDTGIDTSWRNSVIHYNARVWKTPEKNKLCNTPQHYYISLPLVIKKRYITRYPNTLPFIQIHTSAGRSCPTKALESHSWELGNPAVPPPLPATTRLPTALFVVLNGQSHRTSSVGTSDFILHLVFSQSLPKVQGGTKGAVLDPSAPNKATQGLVQILNAKM